MWDPRRSAITFACPLDKVFAREGIAIICFVRFGFFGIWGIRTPCNDLVNSGWERGAIVAKPTFVLLVSSGNFDKSGFISERILKVFIVSSTFAGPAAEEKLPFVFGFRQPLYLVPGNLIILLAINGRDLGFGSICFFLNGRGTCWLMANHAYSGPCPIRAQDFGSILI